MIFMPLDNCGHREEDGTCSSDSNTGCECHLWACPFLAPETVSYVEKLEKALADVRALIFSGIEIRYDTFWRNKQGGCHN